MVSIVEAIFLLKVGFSQFHKKHIAANERKDYWALMDWQNTMEKLGFDADVWLLIILNFRNLSVI